MKEKTGIGRVHACHSCSLARTKNRVVVGDGALRPGSHPPHPSLECCPASMIPFWGGWGALTVIESPLEMHSYSVVRALSHFRNVPTLHDRSSQEPQEPLLPWWDFGYLFAPLVPQQAPGIPARERSRWA